ncbi:MAG: NADAR family protein [Deltaproteobacteria bacterium]|jgi:ribA/ribD-fused uncharacterized protein|nr:NADAR family protein [Deltaproteobacteria bacterium]
MALIGLYGNSSERKYLERIVPSTQNKRKSQCWDAFFICQSFGGYSNKEALEELETLTNQNPSRLFIITGVIPIGFVDEFYQITSKKLLKLAILDDNNKTHWHVGGETSSIELFRTIFEGNINPINNLINYSPSYLVEVYHLLHSATISNISVFRATVNKICTSMNLNASQVSKVLSNQYPDFFNKSNAQQGEINNKELGQGLKSLEAFILAKGENTYFLNSLRRECALLSRTTESYESPYSNKNTIYFHDVDKAFGDFSNFSDHPVFCDGVIWKTVEHYYQAQKFHDFDLQDRIRMTPSPVTAKEFSNMNSHLIKKNWLEIKQQEMTIGVRSKFTQHPDLKALLISTKDKKLYEYSKNDDYWGDPGDGSGQNNLGNILMAFRSELTN